MQKKKWKFYNNFKKALSNHTHEISAICPVKAR